MGIFLISDLDKYLELGTMADNLTAEVLFITDTFTLLQNKFIMTLLSDDMCSCDRTFNYKSFELFLWYSGQNRGEVTIKNKLITAMDT